MNLWPHQLQTVAKGTDAPALFDCSDPGTGKTAANLTCYVNARNAGRLLVVCPKALTRSAWAADIDQFYPDLLWAIADAKNRKQAFTTDADVVITNTDGVTEIAKDPKLLRGFTHLIIDESTTFKHRMSQRSKAMAKIAKAIPHRHALTGTPNPNSVTELWHQVYILDHGRRLGTAFTVFRNAVQTPTQVGPSSNHLRWDDKEGVEEVTFRLLDDILIRHRFEDVMKHVPPNHKVKRQFALTPKAKKVYDMLEATSVLKLKDASITAVHAAAVRTKLLQIASGAVYSDTTGAYEIIDTARYEFIAELVDQYRHCVVFFNWKHQRDLLCKEFDKRGYSFAVLDGDTSDSQRTKAVNDFQAGKLRVILMHPKTGAHGLTLTAGEACIIASPLYEADLLKQMMHRIYRGSQDKVTNTVLVHAEGTVEDLVYQRLDDKNARMATFLELIECRN